MSPALAAAAHTISYSGMHSGVDGAVATAFPSASHVAVRRGPAAHPASDVTHTDVTHTEGTFTDVTFIVSGHPVRLHSCVLAARCEYYRVLLSRASAASTASAFGRHPPSPITVEERDVDLPTFTAVVRYLYTDQLPPPHLLDRFVLPLLAHAQRLGLTRLSRLCQRHLEAQLTHGNAPAMLELADTHGAAPLRAASLSYIQAHYPLVSLTRAFVALREDLLREVLYRRMRGEARAAAAAVGADGEGDEAAAASAANSGPGARAHPPLGAAVATPAAATAAVSAAAAAAGGRGLVSSPASLAAPPDPSISVFGRRSALSDALLGGQGRLRQRSSPGGSAHSAASTRLGGEGVGGSSTYTSDAAGSRSLNVGSIGGGGGGDHTAGALAIAHAFRSQQQGHSPTLRVEQLQHHQRQQHVSFEAPSASPSPQHVAAAAVTSMVTTVEVSETSSPPSLSVSSAAGALSADDIRADSSDSSADDKTANALPDSIDRSKRQRLQEGASGLR